MISIETILFVAAVIVGLIGWLAKRSISSTDRDVEALDKWKSDHEKDSFKWREEFSSRIGKVETVGEVIKNQYAEILRRIDELNQEVKRIAKRDED